MGVKDTRMEFFRLLIMHFGIFTSIQEPIGCGVNLLVLFVLTCVVTDTDEGRGYSQEYQSLCPLHVQVLYDLRLSSSSIDGL